MVRKAIGVVQVALSIVVWKGRPMARLDDVQRFYRALDELRRRLGGYRRLAECTGRMDWPLRGVYFFFEDGEVRTSGDDLRCVRVGTHAARAGSTTTLWTRLRQHRGPVDTTAPGADDADGSIFRAHIGDALDNRIRVTRRRSKETISDVVGRMPFLWLAAGVRDVPSTTSVRHLIEKNAIALLSNYAMDQVIDPPSTNWLGRFSPNPYIVASGLWNDHHVAAEYSPTFLQTLEALIHWVPSR